MPTLDIQTILILVATSVAFGGVALVLLWRSNRDLPGLGLMTVACGLGTLGCLLLALQKHLPPLFGIVVSNTLIIVCLATAVESLRRFYGRRPRLAWLVVVACVVAVGFAHWTYIAPNLLARIRWSCTIMAGCCFYGARVSWRGLDAAMRVGSSFLVLGLFVLGTLQGIRALISQRLFGEDPFTAIALVGTMLSFYAVILGIFMAVGERHLATAKQQRARAEAGEREKGEFLARMSHEIRTPMNGVLGLTELLIGTPLDAQQHQLASSVRSSGKILLRLIDDILDLSKIEAGHMEIETVGFQVRGLLDEVVQLLHGSAVRKGLWLRATVDDEVPVRGYGDPVRIGQVLLNLVGNAVKFTNQGGVEVQVTRHDGDHLSFQVSDTGIGIEPEAHDLLFESFRQSGVSIARRYGGTGLGLAISKSLVGLMDGSIDLRSNVGQGSTFTVLLPCLRRDGAHPIPDSAELSLRRVWFDEGPAIVIKPGPSSGSSRILVVEDEPVNQLVASGMLDSLGYEHDVVADGEAACEALTEAAYGLVLMDCNMPVCDGFTATRRIRAREATCGDPRTPIIAVTASVFADEKERCFEVGMDDVVTKPVTRETLGEIIRSVGLQPAMPTADLDLDGDGAGPSTLGGDLQESRAELQAGRRVTDDR